MKKIFTILGLIAACCAFTSCANKAASDTAPAAISQEAPVSQDYKGEHAK